MGLTRRQFGMVASAVLLGRVAESGGAAASGAHQPHPGAE